MSRLTISFLVRMAIPVILVASMYLGYITGVIASEPSMF